ncbi:MAG: HAD family hydrolase [Armatimonadetes bacterium]|nr:HAD family hydrolase [Armatimonadota bacterium]
MTHPDAVIRAVVFDIGATLVTGPPIAPNKVIAALIKDAEPAEVASVIMTTELESPGHACKVLESKFGPLDAQAATEIFDLWYSQRTAAQALHEASDTVLALKRSGLKIGLLSDIWSPYYASVEKALPEVVAVADSKILSFATGARKPVRDNFVRSLEELGVEPWEAVMVGDTYTHDILPALELGMRTIWVLARPDREAHAIIDILNGRLPMPTATVSTIGKIMGLDLWPSSNPGA